MAKVSLLKLFLYNYHILLRMLTNVGGVEKCLSSGVIEFTNKKLVVLETDYEIVAYLRCWEGWTSYDVNSDGTTPLISVDYKYNVDSQEIIEQRSSNEWVFSLGAEECEIRIKVTYPFSFRLFLTQYQYRSFQMQSLKRMIL